jgi:hypothetical protein
LGDAHASHWSRNLAEIHETQIFYPCWGWLIAPNAGLVKDLGEVVVDRAIEQIACAVSRITSLVSDDFRGVRRSYSDYGSAVDESCSGPASPRRLAPSTPASNREPASGSRSFTSQPKASATRCADATSVTAQARQAAPFSSQARWAECPASGSPEQNVRQARPHPTPDQFPESKHTSASPHRVPDELPPVPTGIGAGSDLGSPSSFPHPTIARDKNNAMATALTAGTTIPLRKKRTGIGRASSTQNRDAG